MISRRIMSACHFLHFIYDNFRFLTIENQYSKIEIVTIFMCGGKERNLFISLASQ